MKTKISLFLLIFSTLFGYHQNATTANTQTKKGMIKVSIFYPNGEDSTFDMDYYAQKHMPMAAELFGDALVSMSIDKGLSGVMPDKAATYVAVGYFYFQDLETMQASMGQHSKTLKADIPNYTNIRPVIQVSEVVM